MFEWQKKFLSIFLLCLLINWYGFVVVVPSGEASTLAEVEIVSGKSASNNSGSLVTQPLIFGGNNQSHFFSFKIVSANIVGAKLLPGSQKVVLYIPDELSGNVISTANAIGKVDVLLSKNGLVGGLLGTVITLLENILNLLQPSLALLSPAVRVVITRMSNTVARLKNLGEIEFEAPIESNGQILVADYQASLAEAIVTELVTLLNSLSQDVKTLKATGGLVGTLVGTLLDPLQTAINNLLTQLVNPTPEVLDELVNGSALSEMEVDFPIQLSKPNHALYGDENGILTSPFYMTILKSEIVDINLFSSVTGNSNVYLQGEKAEKRIALDVPSQLNFGSHEIQTITNERWQATTDGNQSNVLTTGRIDYVNTTKNSKAWNLKAKKQSNWLNGSHQLDASIFIYGANFSSDGFDPTTINYSLTNQAIELAANEEKEIIRLDATSAPGKFGFDLTKFELFIPKNTVRKAGEYQVTVIWTASESP
ncbi:adhesive domain-containing protein [Enterococcus sp. LJL99]